MNSLDKKYSIQIDRNVSILLTALGPLRLGRLFKALFDERFEDEIVTDEDRELLENLKQVTRFYHGG